MCPAGSLPGGGVEVGETALEALQRELFEEGNIELSGPPVLKSIHFNRRASRRDHVAFYLIENYRQATPKLPDREIAEAGILPARPAAGRDDAGDLQAPRRDFRRRAAIAGLVGLKLGGAFENRARSCGAE